MQREKIGLGRFFGESGDVVDRSGQPAAAAVTYPFTKLQILRIDVEINSSSYANFKKFIETVERNIRIMDIREFKYIPKAESFRMELETYYIGNDTDN